MTALTLLLFLGAGVRQWRHANPMYDAEYYAEVQSSFQRHVDSLQALGVLPHSGGLEDSLRVEGELPQQPRFPIDVNSASIIELDALPGIGPGLAARIVEHRENQGPFKSVDDLLSVRGIGNQKLADLKSFATATAQ